LFGNHEPATPVTHPLPLAKPLPNWQST
jgi:hypothetical protein